jgi:hypothetical protein
MRVMAGRLRSLGVAGALVAIVVLGGGAALATAQFRYDRGQDVSPTFDGWERNPDGSFTFYYGYFNRNSAEELDIPVGPDNTIEGGGDRGQPTHFYPGRKWWVFRINVPKDWPKEQRLVWTLKNRDHTNLAKGWLQPEWEVDADLIARNGRDGFLFGGGGEDSSTDMDNKAPTVTGPSAVTVTLPQVATLTVTATDDGRPRPPAPTKGRTPRSGVRFRWILYRGAAGVKFGPDTNGPFSTPEAKGETKVSFASPGTYRLRAIASDGQLFSTHDIDVTVKADPSARSGQ